MKKLIVNKGNYNEYFPKESISGSGSAEDPYIIKDSKLFNSYKTVLKNLSIHLFIEDINSSLCLLLFRTSSNIKFINCNFSSISLYKCHNIDFDHCRFQVLHLSLTHSCMFESCSITRAFLNESRGNSFKDCITSVFKSSKSNRNISTIFLVLTIVLISYMAFTNDFVLSSSWLVVLLFICVGLLVFSILNMLPDIIAAFNIKKFKDNEFYKNSE